MIYSDFFHARNMQLRYVKWFFEVREQAQNLELKVESSDYILKIHYEIPSQS